MLSDKRLFLLDMDGTIYLGDKIFEGTLDFLKYVKETGGRYVYLTNNSSKGTDAYIKKLNRLGIEAAADEFFTSADAAIEILKKERPNEVMYVCGTESLKNQLRQNGFDVREKADEDVNLLLLGYDTELTYEKLENCCRLLMRRGSCDYMATHPDMVCPVPYGFAPDCGSVIEMLKTATGKTPDKIIGKPSPEMAYQAMERFGCTKAETCLIGDRLYTDIACAVNAGIDSIFVLSGEGIMSDIEKYDVHPTYIFNNIKEVLLEIKK